MEDKHKLRKKCFTYQEELCQICGCGAVDKLLDGDGYMYKQCDCCKCEFADNEVVNYNLARQHRIKQVLSSRSQSEDGLIFTKDIQEDDVLKILQGLK